MTPQDLLETAAVVVVSGLSATAVSVVIGVPIGGVSGSSRWGRAADVVALVSTLGLVPLSTGLAVLLALTGRSLDLAFTTTVMAVSQVLLGLIVVTGSTARSVRLLPSEAFEQLDALRLGRAHRTRILVVEVWPSVAGAAVAAFAAGTAVVGSVLLAGGRFAEATRIETPLLVDRTGGRPGPTAGLLLVGLSVVLAVSLLASRRLR